MEVDVCDTWDQLPLLGTPGTYLSLYESSPATVTEDRVSEERGAATVI